MKFCAVVEGWAWAHCDPEKTSDLERVLSRPINFAWGPIRTTPGGKRRRDPSSWQTNTPGEVLLKGRKRERVGGE